MRMTNVNTGKIEFFRRIVSFFSRKEKYLMLLILGMMSLSAGLELLGIGLIVPFITILTNPSLINENQFLVALYNVLPGEDSNSFLLSLGVLLLVIYVAKNLFLMLSAYIQARFVLNKQVSMSKSLMTTYIKAPYAFHLQRNSSELLKNITHEVVFFSNGVMFPMLALLSEAIVMTCVIGFLMYAETRITAITIIVIGMFVYGLLFWFRPLLAKYGRKRSKYNSLMINWVIQGLGAIKETKIAGKENYFIDSFHQSSYKYLKSTQAYTVLNALPRLFIEILGVATMLLVVIIMLAYGLDQTRILPVLALFAVASIRLMPSASRIVGSLNAIRFYAPAVEVIYQEFRKNKLESAAQIQPAKSAIKADMFESTLSLKNLWYKYPSSKEWILKDINLNINKGTSVAFVGATGSGKTTLINTILGLLQADKGMVSIDGVPIQSCLAEWQRCLGYVPQSIFMLDNSIRRNIAFGIYDKDIDDARVWNAVRMAQLYDKIKSLPDGLDSQVGERGIRLSGGEIQRIGIARALYHEPKILIFDEATSALDNKTEKELSNTINLLMDYTTLIIIAHRLTTIINCKEIYFLSSGRITGFGNYQELMRSCNEFRNLATS